MLIINFKQFIFFNIYILFYMTSLLEQQKYQKKIAFFAERIATCRYRFYDMIQTRAKQLTRLRGSYSDEALQTQVQDKVLGSADTLINCLRGEHYSKEIPEYLAPEATNFKSLFYTRLAPKFFLEDERLKLLQKIFQEVDKK